MYCFKKVIMTLFTYCIVTSHLGPSITDGPKAFDRLIKKSHPPAPMSQPGYDGMGYSNVQLTSRDVTAPIDPHDHSLDSSGGKGISFICCICLFLHRR